MKERSDEEKRIAVAEICGWKWIYKKGTWHHARLIDPNGRNPVQHGFGGTPTDRKVKKLLKEWPIHHIPDYLNDISAAFQAVEWLRKEKGIRVLIGNEFDGTFYVSAFEKKGNICAQSENESLPQAICDAFLAVFEKEGE